MGDALTFTSSIHQIGTIVARCPLSYSCMVLFLLLFHPVVHFEIGSKVRYVILCFLCIPRTHKMLLPSCLQNCMWLPFLLVVCVGFLIVFSARRYQIGPSTHWDMLSGMS
ncbi:hypothetical protein P3X46_020653 [Hevea brasiliensis]|uniref:Uncharacterized protein n=1 Tax=Hevea brasiliensis TaxID=3981 RepID=A0ABQ9LMI6_HEVBR|nr:hypothetical protein P3X46_020653 [Hevea brasiliensis]